MTLDITCHSVLRGYSHCSEVTSLLCTTSNHLNFFWCPDGKRGSNIFIKQHISCHSLDGLSSLVKTIPVQTSRSSKLNEKSRGGWDGRAAGMFSSSLFVLVLFLFCAHTVLFFFSSLCIFPLCLRVGCSSPWPVHIPVVIAAGHLTVGHGRPCLQTPCLWGSGVCLFYRNCGRLRTSQLGSREFESIL